MKSRSAVTAACTVLAASTLLTACGGVTPRAAGGAASTETYDRIASAAPDRQRAEAEKAAKSEGGTLSLYTSMTADIVGPITKAFQKDTGVKVEVFRGNSETVLQRISQESQARRAGADVVETNFAEMDALSKEGILATFDGASRDKLNETGRFPDWSATRLNIFHPAWNTDLIKPGQEPKSWEDLAKPEYKGKITLEISDSDWYANVTTYWLKHGKSQAEVDALWKKIAANSKAAKGHTTMMQFLTAGQTAMEAMNYTYITERAKEQGAPVAYRDASGRSTVPAFPRPNGVGLIKGAAHPGAAWLFYDWMLNEGQQVIVDLHLSPSTKVPGDKSLDGLTLAPFAIDALTDKKADWDAKYDALLRGADNMEK
ncbi:extracellular solute-binding protein [Streptomyces sp. SKN60]|uniref:ABC transporter substrate-binding protein n=1 Tax=Streptomyces sp. SKN60 TaxID=2855506 RepID=UPI00224706F3|nr:extracellular solute-binding protein [Streptomyces sp. SKN60]MCX2180228.1 extracellular solute-binding protein [Streptomyces sp. SKN60]